MPWSHSSLWTHLRRYRPIGLKMPFMPSRLAVQPAVKGAEKLSPFGSIAAHLFSWKVASESGRNFISVSVTRCGGAGAQIGHRWTSVSRLNQKTEPEKSEEEI